ncbi:hypothetical protein B0J12DRAFT_328508 [Macrophomina phaseolina]|uniref:C2H2-type domain-containing protein n=1 Tax=Macrophomina phaseolina TaxID=35725 RepID=A0ABQ8FV00_9PEZI|nr:hypothetical protein B0J12DRAFT_328508 [Macrophomina phaseolina]
MTSAGHESVMPQPQDLMYYAPFLDLISSGGIQPINGVTGQSWGVTTPQYDRHSAAVDCSTYVKRTMDGEHVRIEPRFLPPHPSISTSSFHQTHPGDSHSTVSGEKRDKHQVTIRPPASRHEPFSHLPDRFKYGITRRSRKYLCPYQECAFHRIGLESTSLFRNHLKTTHGYGKSASHPSGKRQRKPCGGESHLIECPRRGCATWVTSRDQLKQHAGELHKNSIHYCTEDNCLRNIVGFNSHRDLKGHKDRRHRKQRKDPSTHNSINVQSLPIVNASHTATIGHTMPWSPYHFPDSGMNSFAGIDVGLSDFTQAWKSLEWRWFEDDFHAWPQA